VFGPDAQHLGAALRTAFILARHTALVSHDRFALGADALSAFPHRVLALLFGHLADLLGDLEEVDTYRLLLEHYVGRRPVRNRRNKTHAGSPSSVSSALLRGDIKICRRQPIPVYLDAQAGPLRCNHPPPLEQVAVRHAKLKGILGHRNFEVSAPFISQH